MNPTEKTYQERPHGILINYALKEEMRRGANAACDMCKQILLSIDHRPFGDIFIPQEYLNERYIRHIKKIGIEYIEKYRVPITKITYGGFSVDKGTD